MKISAATIVFFIVSAITAYLFFNMGNILDISQSAKKADAIVVLGGDWEGYRVKRALSLYKKGFSKKIVLNSETRTHIEEAGKIFKTEKEYLRYNNVPERDIFFLYNAGNTMYELKALKKLAIETGLEKLLIVSAPPHLRRVKILAQDALGFSESGLSATYIGSDPPWWHKNEWYRYKRSRNFVISETVKIVSNYIAYVILEKNGLLEPAREYFGPIIYRIKLLFQEGLRSLNQ